MIRCTKKTVDHNLKKVNKAKLKMLQKKTAKSLIVQDSCCVTLL